MSFPLIATLKPFPCHCHCLITLSLNDDTGVTGTVQSTTHSSHAMTTTTRPSCYAQRGALGSNRAPKFTASVEINAIYATPLQHMRHQHLIRCRGDNEGDDEMSTFSGTGGLTGSSPPMYFAGTADLWERVQSLLPLMAFMERQYASTKTPMRQSIVHGGHQVFDVCINQRVGVVLSLFSHLFREGARRALRERLGLVAPCVTSHFMCVCLILMDVEEPPLDALTWVNLSCMECNVTLQVAWDWEEAAVVLDGLAGDGQVSHTTWHNGGGGAQASPVQVLVGALTQTPALLTRQDVVRLCNRVSTVADLLVNIDESSLASLPGVGVRKAKRVAAVFAAPFPTTEARMTDIVVAHEEEPQREQLVGRVAFPSPEGDGLTTSAAASSAATRTSTSSGVQRSDAFQNALQSLLAREMNDDNEED